MYCTTCPWLLLGGIGVHVTFTLNGEVGIALKSVTSGGTVGKKEEEKLAKFQTNFRVPNYSDAQF